MEALLRQQASSPVSLPLWGAVPPLTHPYLPQLSVDSLDTLPAATSESMAPQVDAGLLAGIVKIEDTKDDLCMGLVRTFAWVTP